MKGAHVAAQGAADGRRLAGAAVVGIVALAASLLYLCLFSVDSSQFAIVTAFGRPVQVIKQPGLHFKLPFHRLHLFDNRLSAFTPASSEFLTVEKTAVVAAGTVLWRVGNPQRFFETVFDSAGAQSRVADILFAELGAAIGRNPLGAFVSTDQSVYRAEAILDEVTAKCRESAARDYGIDIASVRLQSFDFPKQNRERVYARMASERGRISMRFRSEGEEEGAKIRAAADRERSQILSEASKVAQQRRGEGEGAAAHIYAQTLTRGPEFYRFLRTMEASRTVLPKTATLVLPVDSELFGLLTHSTYFNAAASAERGSSGRLPARERRAP
jgi:membrane protease subunit HflC